LTFMITDCMIEKNLFLRNMSYHFNQSLRKDKNVNKVMSVTLSQTARDPEAKFLVRPYAQNDIDAHEHDCLELAYVVSGSAGQTLNGMTENVHQGDYFIIDYGSRHSYQNCRELTLINCLFLPEIIDDTLADCRSFDELLKVCLIRYQRQYLGMTPANRIFHDEDGRILALLLGMQEEYECKETGCREIVRGRLLEILILTMRKVVREQNALEEKKDVKSDVVSDMIDHMKAKYKERAVLGDFCRLHHYSQQYVSRKFKQETGLSALEYLQKIRIEKSCELLICSDLSVQDIARSVGYEDGKFFQQVFKRMLHMTPREYRRMTKES